MTEKVWGISSDSFLNLREKFFMILLIWSDSPAVLTTNTEVSFVVSSEELDLVFRDLTEVELESGMEAEDPISKSFATVSETMSFWSWVVSFFSLCVSNMVCHSPSHDDMARKLYLKSLNNFYIVCYTKWTFTAFSFCLWCSFFIFPIGDSGLCFVNDWSFELWKPLRSPGARIAFNTLTDDDFNILWC